MNAPFKTERSPGSGRRPRRAQDPKTAADLAWRPSRPMTTWCDAERPLCRRPRRCRGAGGADRPGDRPLRTGDQRPVERGRLRLLAASTARHDPPGPVRERPARPLGRHRRREPVLHARTERTRGRRDRRGGAGRPSRRRPLAAVAALFVAGRTNCRPTWSACWWIEDPLSPTGRACGTRPWPTSWPRWTTIT